MTHESMILLISIISHTVTIGGNHFVLRATPAIKFQSRSAEGKGYIAMPLPTALYVNNSILIL